MKNWKNEPWRLLVGLASIAYILFLWTKKDIGGIYSGLFQEDVIPLVATTLLVSLVKMAAIAGILLFVRWIIKKCRK